MRQRRDLTWTLPRGNLKPEAKEGGEKLSKIVVPMLTVSNFLYFSSPKKTPMPVLISISCCTNTFPFLPTLYLKFQSPHVPVLCFLIHLEDFQMMNTPLASCQQKYYVLTCWGFLHAFEKGIWSSCVSPVDVCNHHIAGLIHWSWYSG